MYGTMVLLGQQLGDDGAAGQHLRTRVLLGQHLPDDGADRVSRRWGIRCSVFVLGKAGQVMLANRGPQPVDIAVHHGIEQNLMPLNRVGQGDSLPFK